MVVSAGLGVVTVEPIVDGDVSLVADSVAFALGDALHPSAALDPHPSSITPSTSPCVAQSPGVVLVPWAVFVVVLTSAADHIPVMVTGSSSTLLS